MKLVAPIAYSMGGFILISLTTAGTVRAANLVNNGSFEDSGFIADYGNVIFPVGSRSIPDWKVIGSKDPNVNVAWINNFFGYYSDTTFIPYGPVAYDGSYFLDLTGNKESSPWGGVAQTIATDPYSFYTLSFALGGFSGFPGPIEVKASAGSSTFKIPFSFPNSGINWEQLSFDFQADSSSTPISFEVTNGGSGAYKFVGLDNVSVTPRRSSSPSPKRQAGSGLGSPPISAIPEPSNLLGLGIFGLGAFCQRRLGSKKKLNQEDS